MTDQNGNNRDAGGTGARRSRTLRITAFGLAACAVGLLLWSRLILVTNHPRTAIATPPTQPSVNENRPLNEQRADVDADRASDGAAR